MEQNRSLNWFVWMPDGRSFDSNDFTSNQLAGCTPVHSALLVWLSPQRPNCILIGFFVWRWICKLGSTGTAALLGKLVQQSAFQTAALTCSSGSSSWLGECFSRTLDRCLELKKFYCLYQWVAVSQTGAATSWRSVAFSLCVCHKRYNCKRILWYQRSSTGSLFSRRIVRAKERGRVWVTYPER